MYQLLTKDGTKIGHYSASASPAQTAKKIAKVIYETEKLSGKKTFEFKFVKNRTKAEGGDKLYRFSATVVPLHKQRLITIGNSSFYQKYDITVANLNRA
jgi:hypothetical protein